MTQENKVVQLPSVAPKKVSQMYRQHEITVTFDPTEQKWRWSFTFKATLTFDGEEPSEAKALMRAKSRLDVVLNGGD